MMKRFIVFIVCVLIALPGSVTGVEYVPQVELSWSGVEGGSGSETFSYLIEENGEDSYYLEDTFDNGYFNSNWELTFKPDPYVIAAVGVTNTASVPQMFTFIVSSPVSPQIMPTSLHGGDMSGSFTTDPGGGTLSTASPDPLYYGLIDGSGVLQLHPDPSSWTRVSGGTSPIPYAGAGLPPSLPSGPVLTDIGIQFKFTLTPGDAVALTGYFEVVPEPGTICLLGLGGLLLRRNRVARKIRRRCP